MKRQLLILLVLIANLAKAQNLVPNASFEQLDSCSQINQLNATLASPWFQPVKYLNYNVEESSSSDLFNICTSNPNSSVPSNDRGYQVPHEGNGYVGICTYDPYWSDIREYIEVRLTQALVSNKKYSVEFYISLSDITSRASNNMGVHFSKDSLLAENFIPLIDYIPQIECTTVVTNKTEWTKISGEYTANGGERFMTIGNFRNDQNTTVQLLGSGLPGAAYYIIDNVSVTCYDPNGCDTVSPQPPSIPFSVPTILSNNDIFYIRGLDGHVSFTLYDARGRLVYENAQYINDLPLYQFSEGIYFYRVTLQDGRTERGKVVIVEK